MISDNVELMRMSLAAAVPLWAHKMNDGPAELIFDSQRLNTIVESVTFRGDILQFGGAKKGEVAAAFNLLAEGVARAAYAPGGVRVFGLWFEYRIGDWKNGKHGVPVDGPAGSGADAIGKIRAVVLRPDNRKTVRRTL